MRITSSQRRRVVVAAAAIILQATAGQVEALSNENNPRNE